MAYKREPWTLNKKSKRKENNQLTLPLEIEKNEQVETNYSLSVKLGINHATLQKVLNRMAKKQLIKTVPFKRGKSSHGYVITTENLQLIQKEINKGVRIKGRTLKKNKPVAQKKNVEKIKKSTLTFNLFGWNITLSR